MAEQARVGRLLGADPLPETAADLARWVAEHPAVATLPERLQHVLDVRPRWGAIPVGRTAIETVTRPPL